MQADKAGDSSDNVPDAVARAGRAEVRPGLLLAPNVPREAVRGSAPPVLWMEIRP